MSTVLYVFFIIIAFCAADTQKKPKFKPCLNHLFASGGIRGGFTGFIIKGGVIHYFHYLHY